MNQKKYSFKAEIKKVDGINAAYIEFPFNVSDEFGKGRVAVTVSFNGVLYDGSLVKMQTPCHIIGLRKDIRAKMGKQAGDVIDVVITERDPKLPKNNP